MPVRSTIHWWFVFTIFSRSALVRTPAGVKQPTAVIFGRKRRNPLDMLISGEMQQEALFTDFASALLFETPAEIYCRVFRELRPKTAAPPVEVEYCQFANVHSS